MSKVNFLQTSKQSERVQQERVKRASETSGREIFKNVIFVFCNRPFPNYCFLVGFRDIFVYQFYVILWFLLWLVVYTMPSLGINFSLQKK